MPVKNPQDLVRFQSYISAEQHEFLRKLAFEKGISGGRAIRKALVLYAKRHGVQLTDEANA
jgi:hypothetical protein